MESSERAFSEENIRAGFRATGVDPLNRLRVLDRDDLFLGNGEDSTHNLESHRPVTPPAQSPEGSWTFTTPQKGQDILEFARRLEKRAERHAAMKIRKALEITMAENARLRAENSKQKDELRSAKPTRRKKVDLPANEIFASIKEIKAAQDKAEELDRAAASRAARGAAEAQVAAAEMQGLQFEDMCFEFQT